MNQKKNTDKNENVNNLEEDENLANIICEQFAEVVIASSFSRNASKILSWRKKCYPY